MANLCDFLNGTVEHNGKQLSDADTTKQEKFWRDYKLKNAPPHNKDNQNVSNSKANSDLTKICPLNSSTNAKATQLPPTTKA